MAFFGVWIFMCSYPKMITYYIFAGLKKLGQ